MAPREVFLLLVPTRGGNPVDLAQGRALALEGQKPRRHEEIDPALEEALHPIIVALQEERREELQFHLLTGGILQLIDAQERVVAVRPHALPVGGGKAIDLVALGRAVPRCGLETLALHIKRHDRSLPGQQVRNDEARGLTPARRRHDQRMREDLRADVVGAGSRRPSLPRMNPVPGAPKNPLAFISRADCQWSGQSVSGRIPREQGSASGQRPQSRR